MRALLVTAWLAAMLVAAACSAANRCSCGQSYDRDAFGNPIAVGADHDVTAHCYCRCGEGADERMDPAETCESYEGPCERDGVIARFTCD